MLERARASFSEHPAMWIGIAIGGVTLVVIYLAYRNQVANGSGGTVGTTSNPGTLISPYSSGGDQGLGNLITQISQQWAEFMAGQTGTGGASGGTGSSGGSGGASSGTPPGTGAQPRSGSVGTFNPGPTGTGPEGASGRGAIPSLSASLPAHLPAIAAGGPFDLTGTHHAITDAPTGHDLLRR